MGRISQLFEMRDTSGLANPASWLVELFNGKPTASGVHVTERNAMCLPAVWSAVNRISSAVASLPLITYMRNERGKERASNHPVYSLLHDAPNPLMTAIQFRRTLTACVLLWGNGYAYIERDTLGNVKALWPLSPDVTIPIPTVDGEGHDRIVYQTTFRGEPKRFLDYEVLHIAGLGFDGVRGVSVIGMEREAIGLGIAMQEMTGRVTANNAVPPMVIIHPKSLDRKQQKNIIDAWKEDQGGANLGKIGVLGEDVKIQTLGMPLKDAEFLAQRNFTIADVARIFNLPITMLEGSEQASTYASAEQFDLWLSKHTIRPWLVTWEQAISLRLLTGSERQRYFTEHSVEGLLRGDSQARADFYSKMFQLGMSMNEIRQLENMNGIGPEGDKHYYPLNMAEVGKVAEPQPQRNLIPIIRDARERIIKRIRADVMREAEKRAKTGNFEGLITFIQAFFEEHASYAERTLLPICETLGTGNASIDARNHCEKAKNALVSVVLTARTGEQDLISALNALFSKWTEDAKEVF